MEPEQHDVVVLGGGLAGLTAATTAALAGATVKLLDAHPLGGRARTTTDDSGALFNGGPRALYLGGAAERVLGCLGVEVTGRRPLRSGGRVALAGRSHVLPVGAGSLLSSRAISAGSKPALARLLTGLRLIEPSVMAGQSVEDWLAKARLRPDAAALVRALIRLATYTARTDLLDAGAGLAQLGQAVGPGVLYLDGGWQQIVDSLERVALAASVQLVSGTAARSVEPLAEGAGEAPEAAARPDSGDPAGAAGMAAPRWRVATSAGDIHARSVVLALGTPGAAERVSTQPLHLGDLGEPVSAACLELALRRSPKVNFLLGIEEPLYLSRHSPPARLAPEGIEVVHVARYGVRDAATDRAQLASHAQMAGIDLGDVVAERFLARMVVSAAMPLAELGGLRGRPPVVVEGCDGLFLAGDWVGEEGMLGDAVFASGDLAGRSAAASVRRTRSARASGASILDTGAAVRDAIVRGEGAVAPAGGVAR